MKSAGLPSPVELGFDAKFSSWRPDQILAIDRTIQSKKRFIGVVAPTGFGKTLYGVSSILLNPEVTRGIYLTGTKGLQDQSARDFGSVGLVDIRGQRNYPCIALDEGAVLSRYRRRRTTIGCDEGPCHSGVPCPFAPNRLEPTIRPHCPYYGAVHDARTATLVSSNYDLWFAAGAYTGGLGDFDTLVLDEAHDADKRLEGFLAFEITSEDAGRLSTKLVDSDELTHWRSWGEYHYSTLARKIDDRTLVPPNDADGVSELRRLKGTLQKLSRLKDIVPTEWIMEREHHRVRFSPLQVSRYAEEHLFRGIKKVVLTSATITRKTLDILGIKRDESEILEFKSSFPLERRPVIVIETTPSVQVNARMHESSKTIWIRRIDRLIEPRRLLGRKGLIHAVSYARAKEIFELSEHKDLMIWHESGTSVQALDAFIKSEQPAILISPSMTTGIDLPGDLCRYQIIAKVPLPDTRSSIMKVRTEHDPDYGFYLAMQTLVQSCGRAVRNEEDWCENFIVDDTFGFWFFKRAKKFAPRWWLESLEWHETFPDPIIPDWPEHASDKKSVRINMT